MKAALNGVPSLSVLDGWWIEGRIEGLLAGRLVKMDGMVVNVRRSSPRSTTNSNTQCCLFSIVTVNVFST
jgi:hypothetical protein